LAKNDDQGQSTPTHLMSTMTSRMSDISMTRHSCRQVSRLSSKKLRLFWCASMIFVT